MKRHDKLLKIHKNIKTIGDALYYIEQLQKKLRDKGGEHWETNTLGLLLVWNDKRTQIQYQTDACIDYVYSLISK